MSKDIEVIPPGLDEIKIKMPEGFAGLPAGALTIDANKVVIGSPAVTSGSIGTPFNPQDFVKKSDMPMQTFQGYQIMNGNMIMIHTPSGLSLSLGDLVERLMRVEGKTGTMPDGTTQSMRIAQLEAEKQEMQKRIEALEAALKDIPTSTASVPW